MRRRNCQDVVRLVRQQPGISRAELAKEAQLAKATVSAIVDDLLQNAVLREAGAKASSGGRPAVGLSFNPSCGYVIGICLDDTEIAASVLDLDGRVITELRAQVDKDWTGVDVGSFLTGNLDAALTKLRSSRASVLGIGAAVPGPVGLNADGTTEELIGECRTAIQFLRQQLACPLFIDSNTNMAAVAEMTENHLSKLDLVLVARVGHKIRSALIAGGDILGGSGGRGGELGHIRLPHCKLACSCGAVGCINTVSSLDAMIVLCNGAGLKVNTLDDLVSMCKSGNQTARQIVKEAGEALGYGLAMSINLLAPHVVLVSGPAIAAEEFFLGPIRETVSQLALADNFNKCRIIVGSTVHKPESYGAGLLALKKTTAFPT